MERIEQADREKAIIAIACVIWNAAKKSGPSAVRNVRARLMRDAAIYGASADCAELLNGICDIVIEMCNKRSG
jgi:hypothetical protein